MKSILIIAMIAMLGIFTACEDDEKKAADPFASFQYEVSEDNALKVTFTNTSENAESYKWDFGDGETSEEENPVHEYAEEGSYDVVLTATNADGVSTDVTKTLELGPNLLTDDDSKTWKLIREGTVMGIGPDADSYTEWWSLENDGSRPCVFKQTWTFNSDGTMEFDDGGMMWGDDHVFAGTDLEGTCFEATDQNMVNTDGDNVSEWLSGTYDYNYDPSAGTLELIGKGAWMGLIKVTPGGDVKVPQESVTYDVTITEEADYDLMVVSVSGDGFYWQFNYVSYDDWDNQPEVVSFMVDFDFTIDDYTVTFENLSKDATSYSWDFGDGSTSTEENPTHTYAEEGSYDVVLTGTDANGDTKEVTKSVSISLTPEELAPTPDEPEADVISVYSDAYTDIEGVNLDPDWGQSTVTEEVEVQSEMILKMSGLDYQGIDFADNAQDVSGKSKIHVDIYCSSVTDVNLSLIGGGDENPVTLTTEEGVWKSFDIDLSEYTAPDLSEIIQLKFDDAGTGDAPTIFVDNIYFY